LIRAGSTGCKTLMSVTSFCGAGRRSVIRQTVARLLVTGKDKLVSGHAQLRFFLMAMMAVTGRGSRKGTAPQAGQPRSSASRGGLLSTWMGIFRAFYRPCRSWTPSPWSSIVRQAVSSAGGKALITEGPPPRALQRLACPIDRDGPAVKTGSTQARG